MSEITNSQQETQNGQHKEHYLRRYIWNPLFKDKGVMWTAVFTGILTLFTYQLYRVADLTDETHRANARAFLSLAGPVLGPRYTAPPDEWIGQEFSLNWVNSGTTPARNVIFQSSVEAWPNDLPAEFSYADNRASRVNGIVGPKAVYGTLAHVSKADLVSTWQSKSHLFFWGSVVYKDIFPGDPDRLTEFCLEMTHLTINNAKDILEPNAALIGFQWQSCKAHNCYDEDCKDYSAKVKELQAE
jgi:hypothetical protein